LDVELDIIGDGPLRKELENEAECNPRLHLLGNIANEQLPDYLRTYAAFVLPSFYEGHPKTLIEAMSCGLPVITTNVPGINNIVEHGETGWLCNTDANSLQDAILKVLSDLDLQKRLGKNARQYVLKHYSLDRAVKAELAIYQDILEKGTGTNV
ncbi:MAG: glycosyltransferase family 4 protein, partial [bacterium]